MDMVVVAIEGARHPLRLVGSARRRREWARARIQLSHPLFEPLTSRPQ